MRAPPDVRTFLADADCPYPAATGGKCAVGIWPAQTAEGLLMFLTGVRYIIAAAYGEG
jgi:hypothetical protein